jgi:O-antigen ligase
MNIEPVGTTLAVVAIVASGVVLLGWKRAYWALSGLVLGGPFRDFITRWLNAHTDLSVAKVTAIGRWWFAVVATLLVWLGGRIAYRLWRERRIPKPEPVDLLLALLLVLSLLATVASSDLPAAITSFRGYMQPLAVFVLARAIGPSRREVRFFIVLWLIVGLLMAGLALWQATAWTEADYRAEGYVRQDGELVAPYAWSGGQRYLRPASTVSGPNELGLDMVLMLLLAGVWLLSVRRSRSTLALAFLAMLFTAGLGVSASRSALLAFVVATVAMAFLYWDAIVNRLRSAEGRSRDRFLLALAAAVALVAVLLGGSGLITLGIETVRSFAQQYHYLDSIEAIRYLAAHPAGVGMGLVEPKGALALIEAGGTYHVEGSLFQIAMEMGIWGLAAWLAFWGVALARIYRNFQSLNNVHLRVIAGAAFAGWLGSLVAFLFLPLMQSISLMVWLWFLLGVGYQSKSFEAAWEAELPAAVES